MIGQPIILLLLQSHSLTMSWSVWQSYSANTCHLGLITHLVLVASAELHQLEFSSCIGVRVSPLQAAPEQFKFQVSLVKSVLFVFNFKQHIKTKRHLSF